MKPAILMASVALMASACSGPALTPPKPLPPPPTTWSTGDAVTADAVSLDWWKELHDPVLDGLVDTALAHNADLRAATHNWEATRALLREARAARLPIGNVEASLDRNRTPASALQLDTVGGPAVLPTQTLADVGVGFTWELDLFGRVAAAGNEARAERERALWQRRGVEASIAAAVVRAWFDLANADRELALQGRREPLLADVQSRVERASAAGGLRFDQVEEARASLVQVRQVRPQLEAARRNAMRRLATLTGRPAPEGVATMQRLSPAALPIPAYVRAGRPEAILRMRPDVAAAEQELLKATAKIKVARADLYPRINLLGSVGLTAEPKNIFDEGALRFGVGPSISWGLFDMQRIRARISAAGSQAQAAGATWEAAFLKAIEETDAALDALAAARRVAMSADEALMIATRADRLSQARLAAGQDSVLTAAVARDHLLQAQQGRDQAQTQLQAAWIATQVALGAGWRDVGVEIASPGGQAPRSNTTRGQ